MAPREILSRHLTHKASETEGCHQRRAPRVWGQYLAQRNLSDENDEQSRDSNRQPSDLRPVWPPAAQVNSEVR